MKKDKDTTLADRIKFFDFYKDLPQDLSEPSVSGATVSMFAVGLMMAMFISQTYEFMQYRKASEVVIDVNTDVNKLNINMNITMHRAPCHILSLDIVDVTGVHVVDVQGKLNKHRIDKDGQYVGFHDMMDEGANFKQSGTNVNEIYDETIKAMDAGEGCIVEGTVIINKVPGNFHLSTHAFGEVVQRLYMYAGRHLDFTHTIHHLSFGNDTQMKTIQNKYEEKFVFDLDGSSIDQNQYLYQGQLLANYYLDINQVDFVDTTGLKTAVLEGYKHKTSKSILAQMGAPAIFFRYELSPIKIRYTMSFKTWSEYLVSICAIIGGMFVVAGIIESLLSNGLSFVKTDDDVKKQ